MKRTLICGVAVAAATDSGNEAEPPRKRRGLHAATAQPSAPAAPVSAATKILAASMVGLDAMTGHTAMRSTATRASAA